MKDVRPIIGIAAEKQVGKDTVASMITYICNVGVLRCNFRQWTLAYDKPGIAKFEPVIHFADYPKDILSKTFGIERHLFDDIEYKEHKYYLIDKRTFVDTKNKILTNYIIASHNILCTTSLGVLIDSYNGKVAITLRTLMQYFGTEVGRNFLHQDCWVRATMSDAIDIRNKYGYCVIADVRFSNESEAILNQRDGYVIRLTRDNVDKNVNHQSEDLKDVKYDTVIENNGSKLELFYKVVQLIDNIQQGRLISDSPTGEQQK